MFFEYTLLIKINFLNAAKLMDASRSATAHIDNNFDIVIPIMF